MFLLLPLLLLLFLQKGWWCDWMTRKLIPSLTHHRHHLQAYCDCCCSMEGFTHTEKSERAQPLFAWPNVKCSTFQVHSHTHPGGGIVCEWLLVFGEEEGEMRLKVHHFCFLHNCWVKGPLCLCESWRKRVRVCMDRELQVPPSSPSHPSGPNKSLNPLQHSKSPLPSICSSFSLLSHNQIEQQQEPREGGMKPSKS